MLEEGGDLAAVVCVPKRTGEPPYCSRSNKKKEFTREAAASYKKPPRYKQLVTSISDALSLKALLSGLLGRQPTHLHSTIFV